MIRRNLLQGASPELGGAPVGGIFPAGRQFGALTSNFTGAKTFKQFTPRASVSFEPNDENTVYASYAKGFKGGGFDPRGVGASTPLRCVGTAQLDALVSYDPDPDTAAERHRLDALVHRFGEGCLRHDAGLARHMSTPEVARDVDVLRGALRQPKLDYFGASYGTFIGATYAQITMERRKLRLVSIDGVAPTVEALESGAYPHAKSFHFVRLRDAGPTVERFVQFVRSDEGVRALREAGCLPGGE